MNNVANRYASLIFYAATLVIKIYGVGGRKWKRNVAKGSRMGPWLQGQYEIVDEVTWREKQPCLYLVRGSDTCIKYIDISRNGLKHRWRTSPAFDAETCERLPTNQLFHSQCWKHIEAESRAIPGMSYEVRVIDAKKLIPVLRQIGPPLPAFCMLSDDGESVVASVERWLCNRRNPTLAWWNIAMTGTHAVGEAVAS